MRALPMVVYAALVALSAPTPEDLDEQLLKAVEQGRTAEVQSLLSKGADANAKLENGGTALMIAALTGQPAVVQSLLEHGAKINEKAKNGNTALMAASFKGQTNIARTLLRAGAKVNAKSKSGLTALEAAFDEWHRDTMLLLIDEGAEANDTIFLMAAQRGYTDVVDALIETGAYVNVAGQATEEVEPLNVYLFARTVGEPQSKSEKKALEKELKKKKDEAKDARKELDKKLKKQYGKDRDDWPEEQQEEYRLAEEAETMAQFELEYLKHGAYAKGKQQDLDNTLQDIMQAIQGTRIEAKKKRISLVENPDQAHLLVEIFDRAWSRPLFHLSLGGHSAEGGNYRVAVRISPVEAFRSNRLDDIGPKESRQVKVRHAFRHEEPYWILECYADGRWENAAACAAAILNMFIKDNRAVLKGEAPTQ